MTNMMSRSMTRVQFLFLLPVVFLAGCAATEITSQLNPKFAGRSFGKILVHGNFQNLEYRKVAEDKLCAELGRIVGFACFKSSEVFFPAEEHSAEEIASRLAELGVEGILTLQPTGSGTPSTFLPHASTVIGSTVTDSKSVFGGYNPLKPTAHYEAILQSTSEGKVVWYATAFSGGNMYAGWADLITSASSKAASQLVADGVLRTPND